MPTKFTWVDGVFLVIWALPLVYLICVYPSLGPVLPIHFDLAGKPNGYGSRGTLAGVVLLVSGIGLGMALLIRFLPRIDPKNKARYSQAIFVRIGYALLLFMSLISAAMIYASVKRHFVFPEKILYPVLGLFYAYLGNLFNNVKPNYFVGIRTPWTLENEVVWRKTHQLAARIWVAGGILLAMLGWALPESAAQVTIIAAPLVMAIVPVVYSYLLFRQSPK
jgi:immunity protein, SdpI family